MTFIIFWIGFQMHQSEYSRNAALASFLTSSHASSVAIVLKRWSMDTNAGVGDTHARNVFAVHLRSLLSSSSSSFESSSQIFFWMYSPCV